MTASPKGSDALAVGRAARAARRATILIAEHTAEQAELLHLGLEAAGYSVLVARDGSEALAAAKAERPDAVVSDIELPGMDGYGLCRAIRSDPALASTPVILLTPLSDPLDVIRGLDAGADGYLTKPYDVPTLVARIEALLAAPPAPPPALERRRVQIHLGGETHSVDAHGPRLLNLLISTYENAMLQNRDLGAARRALDEVNEGLERKVRENTAAVAASENKYRRLFEAAQDGILLLELESGQIMDVNPFMIDLLGYTREQYLGKKLWEIGPFKDIAASKTAFAELQEKKYVRYEDLPLRTAHGKDIAVEFVSNVYEAGGLQVIQCNIRDVTARRQAERAQKLFRELVDRSSDTIEVVDPETLRYIDVNDTACQSLGYSRDELLSMRVHDIDAGLNPSAIESMNAQLRQSGSLEVESIHRRKDGSTFPVEVRIKRIELGRTYNIVSIRDITERTQAQAALERSARRNRKLIERGADVFFVIDASGAVTYRSPSGAQLTGWSDEEVVGKGITDHVTPEHLPAARQALAEAIRNPDMSIEIALQLRRKDGALRDIEITGRNLLADPDVNGIVLTARDITERKRAEEHLRRLNWALRALSQSNSALVHAGSEDELFRSCCAAIASAEGYALAWIGLARSDPGRSVKVVAAAGEALAYMQGLEVSAGDTPHGAGPAGRAIRSGATQVVENLAADSSYGPWLERAQAQGLVSGIVLPFKLENQVLGALAVYSREPAAFGADEVKLLEEMAGDIGYGIGTRRTRHAFEAGLVERARQAIKLRETLESAIGALAATVEQRDPYTAGHQRRVAGLAVAIGREMGFADDRLTGLHVAGTIHDIGKISVPAEILSRPGKLSSVEFELIKGHAQAGYEIIKGVDFPWPVAQAIWQHHERLDGSGYPRGLKGDQVILDARILAVADVVEAMSSHRPYRAGLGVDFALKEIEDKRGQLFDPAVVDACLRVFRERSFAFAS